MNYQLQDSELEVNVNFFLSPPPKTCPLLKNRIQSEFTQFAQSLLACTWQLALFHVCRNDFHPLPSDIPWLDMWPRPDSATSTCTKIIRSHVVALRWASLVKIPYFGLPTEADGRGNRSGWNLSGQTARSGSCLGLIGLAI